MTATIIRSPYPEVTIPEVSLPEFVFADAASRATKPALIIKGGLIADVFAAATDLDWRPPHTGSLCGDLTELNREIQDSLTEEPSIALALIAVSFRSEDAARALRLTAGF